MKSRFPSVELDGVPLVMDASAIINFLGSGMPEVLLRNLGLPVLVAGQAFGEVRRHPIPGEPIVPAMAELTAGGFIQEVKLGPMGYGIFLELVANDLSGGLDDGEAATIAAALEHPEEAIIVVDEKKAARTVAMRWPERRCVDTMTVFAQTRVRGEISEAVFADAMFSALRHARMRVPEDGLDWIISLIGNERGLQCPSLGPSLRRRL
jgi:predicted nucleic acid-binding protein